MTSVLVTGGTGLLGRRVCRALTADGHTVRILSRGPAEPPPPGVDVSVADLSTGAGLAAAVAGVGAVVHCATDPRASRAVDVDGTERLLEAARRVGRPHVVHVSIVGVDRIPTGYYRAKLAAEAAIARSGLPATVLRATQFHEFALDLVDRVARLPLVPVPRGARIQPIDVDEVARRLADAVASGSATRLPDIGGPEVLPVADLVRERLDDAGRHRPVLELPLPGAVAAALRAGANLAPGNRSGGRTWREFLDGRSPSRLPEG
ncbi:Uncharacterized conserved protein YbjT, contains NAD(P)-binding and DUF2867 domains [Geodermatophilus saharensis]|uniref:Uncharacterized conserved protein YbjT, contains NAD(P)-binding and DUF2867 domains n=1 Tax=Geodermatophilus saharensis TaxID=1137994 RepID=A0A239IT44_9ACTN|nr:SDR family oxidoreductase [Geodermatophilus saharensis]SNS96378.1 Uncharacterized conserved protein YbjT, contains NAD(P)-binding and DUF2867 domains [Geodermatophilus saharensis]